MTQTKNTQEKINILKLKKKTHKLKKTHWRK